MSQIRIHPIGDHVYVRDVQYEWLPAIVEDVKEHEVLVRITLPNDWVKTTIRRNGSKAEEIDNGDGDNSHNKFDNKNIDHHKVVDVIDGEKRWVKLAEYFNHHLPLQNWDEDDTTTSATKGSNDMSQLRHINEAELLYQIKKRYCSLDQPYTRITTLTANSSNIAKTTNMMVMVAVNPCRYIPSLYTIEKQRYYIQYYMEQQQQQQQQKELPRPSSPFVTTDETEDIHAPSFDEKKEEDDDLHLTTTSSRCAFAPVSTFVSDRAECEPHIYEISSLAYHSLITTQTNQAIIVSGESGSGKTESIKIVMKHLASSTPVVSAPQQSKQYQQVMGNCSDNDLVSLLLASSPIFESFGNAKTFSNSNSSRFGKVTKLHYLASSLSNGTGMEISNTESKIGLIGSSFQTYMLEANRVVSHVEGERNYHIFYQMLAAPAPVKNELLGSDWREATPNDFRYLNRYNCGIEESSIDATNWTQTLKALIIFGWDGESLERLIRALGIVLLIGNIEFEGSDDNKASIEQTADLIMLSTSLGIHAAELELALTQRMIQTTHDLVLVPFTPEQANEACEALSKTIYIRIFDAIVRQINCFTFRPNGDEFEETKTIALVDIFGFETFEVNRFEQFCINYANERLQQKYILDSLSHHQMDCQEEGITIPEWKNIDNTSIVELFECVPGLIQSLNDQCRLPNGSSEDFVSIVKQLHHDHEHFGHDKCKTSTAFCVYHFAGPVVYDASKFVERNADKLPDFLISVVATSTNGLIAHELGDMMKERYSAARSTMKSQRRCAIDVFQWQLKELLLSVDSCHTRYIRCIKPCHDLTVLKRMDHRIVLRQLQSSGLVAAVEQSRMIFPDKLSFETIATRYSCLLSSNAMSSIEDMDLFDKAQVILSSVYAPIIEQYNGSAFAMPFSCGHSKVLFRAGAMGILEKKRRSLLLKSAIIIQSAVRSYTRRQSTVRCIHGFVLLQSTFRGQVVSREFKKIRKSAVKLQAYGRFVIFRLKLLKVKVSILQLQKWWIRARIQLKVRRRDIEMKRISALKINMWLCGYILAQRQQKQNDSILFISAWLRMVSQRKSFSRFKRSATIVAAWFRAIRTKKRYDEFRKAATAIARRRKFLLEVRSHKERRQEKRKIHEALEEKIVALRKLQSFFRSKRSNKSSMSTTQCENNQISTRYGNIDKSSPAILDSSDASLLPKCDERSLSTPHTVFEQLEMYRRQIADLKSDITLLTSEAELHKQEVEAEFEDRLAEYEIEVLQLKQKVESLKNENVALKDEVAANVENVQNLKMGIQSMHEAHREYLNKVMRAVENANREHQIALELVQREKEKQVKELSDIVDRLQSEHRDNSTIKNGAENRLVNERIYHIARKIEKITAPDCIVAIAKKVRKVNTKEEYVEEKFSGRIRQLLYKLEDVAASSPPHSSCEEEYIVSLQQKLILAKSEIERLNKIIDDSRSKQAAVGRHGLKKFFER